MPDEGSIAKGFGIGAAINIGAALVGALTIMIAIGAVVLLGFGLIQAVWIGPLVAKYNNRGETETAKGLLLAAGVTFLLNAGCWGAVLLPRH
jgi:hypothetical protein